MDWKVGKGEKPKWRTERCNQPAEAEAGAVEDLLRILPLHSAGWPQALPSCPAFFSPNEDGKNHVLLCNFTKCPPHGEITTCEHFLAHVGAMLTGALSTHSDKEALSPDAGAGGPCLPWFQSASTVPPQFTQRVNTRLLAESQKHSCNTCFCGTFLHPEMTIFLFS